MVYEKAQEDCKERATEKGVGWTGGLAILPNRADRDASSIEIGALLGGSAKYWLGFKGENGKVNKLDGANWKWSDDTPVSLVEADWHHRGDKLDDPS